MTNIERTRRLRDESVMYSFTWWHYNRVLAKLIREWREDNTLTLVK